MVNTRPRLGELLLATGVCSREQLREAWEQRVLYGDRLGTNLLSLGAITEQQLAAALGQQHGVHSGHGRVISPDKNALKLVPKTVAVRRCVVPHHVADKQLYLMMRDPHDPVALDEAAFAANMRVVPVVVCEARLWQLLEIHYHQVMSLRPVPLDGVVPHYTSVLDDAAHAGAAALGPELTSEEEFQRLYAGIHAGVPMTPAARDEVVPPPITPEPTRASSGPRSAVDDFMEKTSPARPLSILAERDPTGHEGVLAPPRPGDAEEEWRDTIEKTQPMMAKPRISEIGEATVSADDDSVHGPIIDLVEVTESSLPAFTPETAGVQHAPAAVDLEPPLVRQQTADFHVEIEAPVDESPLSFADASKLLASATDRTDIARVVLRAARTKFARAALFSVFPDRLVGWMGIGDGVDSERLRDLVMKRGDKSVFAQVADNLTHYLGPLPRSPVHGAWVKRTGRKIPKAVALFPILVRGRPVNVLYVDNGHEQSIDGGDVGEVLILAQQIAKSYETLLTSV